MLVRVGLTTGYARVTARELSQKRPKAESCREPIRRRILGAWVRFRSGSLKPGPGWATAEPWLCKLRRAETRRPLYDREVNSTSTSAIS